MTLPLDALVLVLVLRCGALVGFVGTFGFFEARGVLPDTFDCVVVATTVDFRGATGKLGSSRRLGGVRALFSALGAKSKCDCSYWRTGVAMMLLTTPEIFCRR